MRICLNSFLSRSDRHERIQSKWIRPDMSSESSGYAFKLMMLMASLRFPAPRVRMVDSVASHIHRCAIWQVAHIIHEIGTGQGGSSGLEIREDHRQDRFHNYLYQISWAGVTCALVKLWYDRARFRFLFRVSRI